ncbi:MULTISPECIES: hypothetical protein [Thermaerobacter]|uniref:Uncharacterized protein n=1 Tax=Thermaerobacter composti TaxID=554949 RepID=A0ABZ0QN01_9FIRM|nr:MULTISPECIES: hypothetical protein [Thermaerobacter]WPD18054.1 hypothetical protein Q5761_06565 [Thermaerobacter composti]
MTAVRVFVNNHPVDVYPGASVRHALLRYSETVYQDAVAGKLVVTDRHGNRLGLGGALEEGLRLTVEGPGGYRPGPARPAATQEVAGGQVDGRPPAASTNGLVLTEARPGGRAPAGGPAAGPAGAAEAAAAANGVHPAGRGDGRRRRRGRRRGRRGRPRAHPEVGKGGRATEAGGSANGTG